MTEFNDDTRRENLTLWNEVCVTDPDQTKSVNNGKYQFTAIDAYAQIWKATEVWGPYGSLWGLYDLEYHFMPEVGLCRVSAIFKYPGFAFPLNSAIKYVFTNGKPDEDFAKKVETDLITKALSRLGFNADVFLGMFDDDKYVQGVRSKKYLDEMVAENRESIDLIKESIETEDYQPGAERWFTMSNELKTVLWTAPSKGGPFTTNERKVMQSPEFRKSYYGEDDGHQES